MKYLILLVVIAFSANLNAQDCDRNSREVKKEAKKRVKAIEKQGYTADFTIGSAEEMFKDVICHQKAKTDKEAKYYIESITGKSASQTLATSKARDNARNELGKNMGSYITGIIEKDGYFVNGSNEDIKDEIEKSFGAFDEVFEAELKRNKVIGRFFRTEDNGNVTCWVIIAMDKQQFIDEIKKLKKQEIQARLEKVRDRM